jgi:hypothetical protein
MIVNIFILFHFLTLDQLSYFCTALGGQDAGWQQAMKQAMNPGACGHGPVAPRRQLFFHLSLTSGIHALNKA